MLTSDALLMNRLRAKQKEVQKVLMDFREEEHHSFVLGKIPHKYLVKTKSSR